MHDSPWSVRQENQHELRKAQDEKGIARLRFGAIRKLAQEKLAWIKSA